MRWSGFIVLRLLHPAWGLRCADLHCREQNTKGSIQTIVLAPASTAQIANIPMAASTQVPIATGIRVIECSQRAGDSCRRGNCTLALFDAGQTQGIEYHPVESSLIALYRGLLVSPMLRAAKGKGQLLYPAAQWFRKHDTASVGHIQIAAGTPSWLLSSTRPAGLGWIWMLHPVR
jgi:hypothetical protein